MMTRLLIVLVVLMVLQGQVRSFGMRQRSIPSNRMIVRERIESTPLKMVFGDVQELFKTRTADPVIVEKPKPDMSEVQLLSRQWGNSLKSKDRSIASLYDPKALLYATFKTRLSTPSQIQDYFYGLFEKDQLAVTFDQEEVRMLSTNVAISSGTYAFSYLSDTGVEYTVPARFTFLYGRENEGAKWKILEHHSSVDPERAQGKEVSEVEQVAKNWQTALKTKDRSIASIYAPEALLYATFKTKLSTPSQIQDYFYGLFEKDQLSVEFHKHDVRVLSTDVAISSGTYTFSYVSDAGDKVLIPARFTFVYRRETAAGDALGPWKFVEHHSSMDPEK